LPRKFDAKKPITVINTIVNNNPTPGILELKSLLTAPSSFANVKKSRNTVKAIGTKINRPLTKYATSFFIIYLHKITVI
jgi:hypothetical protein